MISEASRIDLERLVHQLRQLRIQLIRIPEKSGSASSDVRRARRAERRRLRGRMSEIERMIVSWALVNVSIDELPEKDESDAQDEER